MRLISEEVVGRDEEIGAIDAFLVAARPDALVLEGEPGIGKTTLVSLAVERARGRGFAVLFARPTAAETPFAFAALGDLLEQVPGRLREELPPPQARALRVALREEEAGSVQLDTHSIALAVRGVLRALARDRSVLVAIDDGQWLDEPTRAVLDFALRRLEGDDVRILIAVRPDRVALALNGTRVLVRPLSVGALHRLLQRRLGRSFPRPLLRRLHETAAGNPFFALELARTVDTDEGSAARPRGGFAVPPTLKRLVAARLSELPDAEREPLLVAALAADPTVDLVGEVLGRPVLFEVAEDQAVVALEDGSVRFTHPLLAAGLVEEAGEDLVRQIHLRLAQVAHDSEQRAHHLGRATVVPDGAVADTIDAASATAYGRSARSVAAELAETAFLLTPDHDPRRAQRAARAGTYFIESGDAARGGALLRRAVEIAPFGPERAEAIIRFLAADVGAHADTALVEEALAAAESDAAVRARVHFELGEIALLAGALDESLVHSRSACAAAREVDDPRLWLSMIGRCVRTETLALVGDPEPELNEAVRVERGTGLLPPGESPRFSLAQRLLWHGRLDEARSVLDDLRSQAISTDDEYVRTAIEIYLVRLELRAGNWTLARSHAERADESTAQAGYLQARSGTLSVRALVEAHVGNTDAALELADASDRFASDCGDRWFPLHNRMARGLALAGAARFDEAGSALGDLGADLDAAHIREPGAFPFEADAVEAFAATGSLEAADRIAVRVEERANALGRDRLRSTALRCRGVVRVARRDEAAIAAFDEALRLDDGSQPFERARTLLVLGGAQRRARRIRDARDSLQAALACFESLGAEGFAARTRSELDRLSGRRTAGGLTPTEQRVASLVAEGLTNREVAASLVVSVSAVEAHLTRIYEKLGIRSRAALARQLAR